MLEKSSKKDNFLRTSASGETGSPRLFTYREIWTSAIINDLTIYCLKKLPVLLLAVLNIEDTG